MKQTILVTESSNFSPSAANTLGAAGLVILADLNREELKAAVSEADTIFIRLRHRIDREVMNAAPRLKLIATPTTGLNHIDMAEAGRRGIQVISLRGETEFLNGIHATAEHTLALILGLLRHLPEASHHVAQGGWDRDSFRGRELHGKTAGIVGYGRVGRMVATYLQALGMNVLATDPNVDISAGPKVKMVSLPELLRHTDLVTLHAPLNDRTEMLVGRTEFAQMKPGSWFINTARGELVDENAFLAALQNGPISGGAVDVLSGESSAGMSDHPLVAYARTHPNLLITPHIAGCTVESMEKTENFIAGKVAAFIQSQPQETCVEVGDRKAAG